MIVWCGGWWLGCAGVAPEGDGSDPPGLSAPAPAPPPRCGDGVVDPGEGCDEGLANALDGDCTPECQPAACGDGWVHPYTEACDNGADNADDAECTSSCGWATCGDGLVWTGVEACDDGPANADDAGCTSTCSAAVCGDGLLWAGQELCDDGNTSDGDNCDPDCLSPVRLSSADARLLGEATGDAAGTGLDYAGDVNGDGFDDLIIGANDNDAGGTGRGVAYVVHGPVGGDLDLANADAILLGEADHDNVGISVDGAGDVDGDGTDDLIVGAFTQDGSGWVDAGAAYLVHGPVVGQLDLSGANAKLLGEAPYDYAGYAVAGVGDVDDDGFDDVLVGAYRNDEGGSGAGIAYLVRGPMVGGISMANADARLVGVTGDAAGHDVSRVGDVDGDGLDDLLISAHSSDVGGSSAGGAYVVHSPVSGTVDLATGGEMLVGEASADLAGWSLGEAGDVDGDGLADLIIGSQAVVDGLDVGAAYLVLAPVVGTLSLGDADAKLVGVAFGDGASGSVDGAGDVDGDGGVDLIVGAAYSDRGGVDAGTAYLLFGPIRGRIELATADRELVGDGAGATAGGRAVLGGDLDGDGRSDVVIGAAAANGAALASGSVFVVSGATLAP